jgi:hypothetical protein
MAKPKDGVTAFEAERVSPNHSLQARDLWISVGKLRSVQISACSLKRTVARGPP